VSRDIPERDWKVFRELREVALGRLCDKILIETKAAIDDPAKSSHEKYLKLYELIQRRDAEIARAFNDLRHSTAIIQIGIIYKMGLFTREELQRFSPETLDVAALYVPIPDV
jgi:hypothetical protein